jgi:hypothetical protein
LQVDISQVTLGTAVGESTSAVNSEPGGRTSRFWGTLKNAGKTVFRGKHKAHIFMKEPVIIPVLGAIDI